MRPKGRLEPRAGIHGGLVPWIGWEEARKAKEGLKKFEDEWKQGCILVTEVRRNVDS